jgi:hypothetical protein
MSSFARSLSYLVTKPCGASPGLEDPAVGVLEDIVSADLRHGRELATEAQSPP